MSLLIKLPGRRVRSLTSVVKLSQLSKRPLKTAVVLNSNSSVNPDLAKARAEANIDAEELTYFLYDGKEKTERKRQIQNTCIEATKDLGFRRFAHLNREETYEEGLKRCYYAYKKQAELGLTELNEVYFFREIYFLHVGSHPVYVHEGMFIPTIERQGTEEQRQKWLPRCKRMEVLGTYAQTELGHGTNLRALETTATYDPEAKEFVLSTPTETSIKWWPSGLGHTANHCIVMAMLHTKGKNEGLQPFIVPLRDVKTHEPLQGISVGDLGPKMGNPSMDHGYLRMDNVRIPRENMLMRYSQVLEDGTFVKAQNDRLLYGSMILMRAYLVSSTARCLAQAVTIATRYSAVRKQGELAKGAGEVPVMEFQTQQNKVFTQLASAYALISAGKNVASAYQSAHAKIEAGDLSQLPILHAVSAGMKAFATWEVMHGIEQCRMACGGHGYMLASGLPRLYTDTTPAATYEGENTVMMLQTARFLMKCQQALMQGEELPPLAHFMKDAASEGATSQLTDDLHLDHLVEAFEHRAAGMTREAAQRLQSQLEKGLDMVHATNNSSQMLVDAAMAFCHAYAVRSFAQWIKDSNLKPSEAGALTQLCQLYACQGIAKNSGDFTKGGYMSDQQVTIVREASLDLLSTLKPNAQALVDAFDFPDQVLDSDLGRRDGNVYDNLVDHARQSKLNASQVHPAIHKYLKPLNEALTEFYKDQP